MITGFRGGICATGGLLVNLAAHSTACRCHPSLRTPPLSRAFDLSLQYCCTMSCFRTRVTTMVGYEIKNMWFIFISSLCRSLALVTAALRCCAVCGLKGFNPQNSCVPTH